MGDKQLKSRRAASPARARALETAMQGNNNPTKHGLFAQSFAPGSTGEAAYQEARRKDASELARDAAHLLLAQVAEAYKYDPALEEAKGAVAECLRMGLAAGVISQEAAQRALKRMVQPDLVALGKALGPLRSLLARMDGPEDAKQGAPNGVIVINAKAEDWGQAPETKALPSE